MAVPETLNGVKVSVITRAVQRIEKKHGVCHPSMLVEAARPERSPLHGMFEWDDTAAAANWRTHQARMVISKIRVVVDEDTQQTAPAFVHVTQVSDAGVLNGYMTTARALASPARDGVLRDALSQLQGLRRRYESLAELSPVWEALDALEERAAA